MQRIIFAARLHNMRRARRGAAASLAYRRQYQAAASSFASLGAGFAAWRHISNVGSGINMGHIKVKSNIKHSCIKYIMHTCPGINSIARASRMSAARRIRHKPIKRLAQIAQSAPRAAA